MGKTSIYAVARQGDSETQPASEHAYRKAEHLWTITVESHPLLGIGKADVVEYGTGWDDAAGHRKVYPLTLGSHDSILGSVLVSDDSHLSQKDAEKVFRQHFEHKSSLDSASNSEDALKHSLRALQESNAIDKFDIDAFVAFAHGYLANRQEEGNDYPGTIAYPQLHPKQHKEKSKKHGFWVSYPETAQNRSGENIYGGLM